MAREPGNQHDRYAIAVLEDQTLCTIGYIPCEISNGRLGGGGLQDIGSGVASFGTYRSRLILPS